MHSATSSNGVFLAASHPHLHAAPRHRDTHAQDSDLGAEVVRASGGGARFVGGW